MKNKFLIAVTLLFALAIIVACSDEFLDTPTQGAISSDVLSSSEQGVDASLIAVYNMLNGFTNTIGNTWGAAPSNYIFESAADDVHKGSEPSDNPDGYYEVSLYQWSTNLGVFRHKWGAVYEGIKRANNAINIANAYRANGGSEDFVNRVVGEATFLRAWYHFDAYRIFVNVPYYLETDTDFRKPNDQPVLPLIIADLEKAITLLPADKSAVGRVDRTVAQALLGKVKLFNKDYTGAKAEFEKVVGSGKYELAPCYNDNFTIATQNNSESLFAFQASVNDGDGNSTNSNFLERLAAPHVGTGRPSVTGCCGFNNPTQDFVNNFRVDANGLPVADWNAEKVVVGTAQTVDPRLDWTVGRTDVPYLDWGPHDITWIRGLGWAGVYSPKKNMKLASDPEGPGWTTGQLHAKNVEFLRYADVLLMLAEAEVESNGDLEEARRLVNMVRERAGNCAQGPDGGPLAVPIDDPAITWATYKVGLYPGPWTDQEAARTAVRRERRLELGTEGHRLPDLRRWGVLESVVTAYMAYEKTVVNNVNGTDVRIGALDAAGPVLPRHYAFPIPSTEIELSNGALIQNDGF
ncbi:MAG: RagB/SusD family nutrient uptake outer membrane protein [Phaeodactylibacter sp.]|nr:RagB/SusD family nutrient uptake outer membrane protein [Phaeodactylibacter sp.]MCB9049243.1 RagB/SusD family nutrient uptake outer membrane protein [Lewinellaceae bacterium]